MINKNIKGTYDLPIPKKYNNKILLKESFKTSKSFYSKNNNLNRRRNTKFEDYFFSSYSNNNLEYSIFKTIEGYKNLKISDFIINLLPCFLPCKKFQKNLSKNKINYLIDFRKNIISEEAMFSLFYIQTTFNNILLNRDKII